MTAEIKITNRIDGWEMLMTLNQSHAVKIGETYHPPLGKGKGRKLRLQRLRKEWRARWVELDKWNWDAIKSESPYHMAFILRVL